MTGLCSVPLWIQTGIKNILTKTKVKQKQSLPRSARKGLKPRSSKGKNVSQMFLKVHPYSNCLMKPESLHCIKLPWECDVQRGLLTFKLLAVGSVPLFLNSSGWSGPSS